YPDLDAGYVVFSNYQGVPGRIASVVADAFFGEHMTEVEPPTASASGVDVPVSTLRRYTGKHEMRALRGTLGTVNLEDGELRVELPGQPPLPLQATSMTKFQVVGAPEQISFDTNDDGTVERIVFHQDGEHPGKPVGETAPPDL